MKAGRILIVENDPLWQELLQDPLQHDYDLTVVSNKAEAEAALEAARATNQPFQVVTVDIGLTANASSLDGEEILAVINQYHRYTKCIVVSGHDQVGTTRLRNYFKQFDVFDYMAKANFDLERFRQIIDAAFDFHGYRLIEELGRGGMGIVYRAADPRHDNRPVALKVLHNNTSLSPELLDRRLARFRQEVEAIRRLVHPNIVAVYDYVITEAPSGQAFFVMEYLAGITLEKKLARQATLPPEEARSITSQLCHALAYAHGQGIIHRDIKPSNIILLEDGQIKITDFGIAKILNTEANLTHTEEVVGTLDYMPPEQIFRAKEVDPRVDVYATGAILYEMLSSQKPYADPLDKLHSDPTPLPHCGSPLTDHLAEVAMKALARSADERYQSAEAMAAALSGSFD